MRDNGVLAECLIAAWGDLGIDLVASLADGGLVVLCVKAAMGAMHEIAIAKTAIFERVELGLIESLIKRTRIIVVNRLAVGACGDCGVIR